MTIAEPVAQQYTPPPANPAGEQPHAPPPVYPAGEQPHAPPPVYPAGEQPHAPPPVYPAGEQPHAPPPVYPAEELPGQDMENKSMVYDSFAAIGGMFTGNSDRAIEVVKNSPSHTWVLHSILYAIIAALGLWLFFSNMIDSLVLTRAMERQLVDLGTGLVDTAVLYFFNPDFFLMRTRELMAIIQTMIEDVRLTAIIWTVAMFAAGFLVSVVCIKLLYSIKRANVSIKATANTVAASLIVPGTIGVIAIIAGFASLIAAVVIAGISIFAYYVVLYGAVKKAGDLNSGPIWGFLLISIIVAASQLAVIVFALPSLINAIDFFPLSEFIEIDYYELTVDILGNILF